MQDLREEALRMGYQSFDIDEHFVLKKERAFDGRNVTVSGSNELVQIEMQVGESPSSKYAKFIFSDPWKAFLKLREVDEEVFKEDNSAMFSQENIKAARMVQEVRTLSLSPNDRLLVVVRDNASHLEMYEVGNLFSQWLGDKGHNRVMVTKSVQVTKVNKDGDKS